MKQEMPDVAILDADIIAYKAACWAEATLDDRESEEAGFEERINADLSFWTPPGVSRILLAFSCSREDNYRRDFWPDYKMNRAGKPKPRYLGRMKEILCDKAHVVERPRLEADDIIGLGMSSMLMVGVSLDKDLRSCPGWYFNPDKIDFPVLLSQEYADEWFHKQWLMGDSTDHIPGIPKVGPVKAQKMLDSTRSDNWSSMVMAEYEKRGFDYDYCMAQARCVRILRYKEWDKDKEEPILWSPAGR